MSVLKKILFGAVIAIGIILFVGSLYLFVDSPFPDKETSGLTRTDSKLIQAGKAVSAPGDSMAKNISANGNRFVDRTGRTMILHGINVGGDSKIPFTPFVPSHQKENFYESVYTVSFVGRPFPLKQADAHLKRLHQWGYRFLRLMITWEAIEHAGPGNYDEAYLNYLQAIVKKAAEYDINVFIDPHQDAWSRFTGGDGAPYWTLEKAGFDPLKFTETGSAVIHNMQRGPFPRMIWPTNYHKLGAATMFTLFFGGNDFAPHVKVDSLNIQDYLQSHYLNAMRQVALKLKGLPNVIGFDVLNEPSAGYIGMKDLNAYGLLKNGFMPTPLDGMVLGAGNALNVDRYEFALTGATVEESVQLNPNTYSAWKTMDHDIWKTAGVWSYDNKKAVVLKPDYFTQVNGKPVDFSQNYYKPFINQFKEVILSVDSTWLIFVEAPLFNRIPEFIETESTHMLNAGHSYDLATLLTKNYSSWFGVNAAKSKPVFGKRAIRNALHDNIARRKEETKNTLGNKPTLIGEFGIPFDLADKRAYQTGDFSDQEAALDRCFRALESNGLSYAMWNYSAGNTNLHGDQWNDEDLSIFSMSQQTDPADINSGGRALRAAIRPYPYKVAGEPISYFFDIDATEFYLKFKLDKSIAAPTEIFLPQFHFGKGFEVLHTPGKLEFDTGKDLLLFYAEGGEDQVILVRGKN